MLPLVILALEATALISKVNGIQCKTDTSLSTILFNRLLIAQQNCKFNKILLQLRFSEFQN